MTSSPPFAVVCSVTSLTCEGWLFFRSLTMGDGPGLNRSAPPFLSLTAVAPPTPNELTRSPRMASLLLRVGCGCVIVPCAGSGVSVGPDGVRNGLAVGAPFCIPPMPPDIPIPPPAITPPPIG